MTQAQHQVNARNQSALLNSKDANIIRAFWWPHSRADVACILQVHASHVKRVWDDARSSGQLPRIERPAKGFETDAEFMAAMANAERAA